ncbi:hypothetical protein [Listeria booriae]|uniref:hypothetical protein n=1 Tax=Listeria booriae TaxID=1552123 RepID=UPI0016278270|nr:hypothetical protein [Listeria booriae]MBC1512029.1 hypothetical protein [Listeria booriae]MBC6150859.1 hypothetical protein [Listeria booriae]MBC6305075.1 hypothetical protein [Listeria booriae]
MNILPINENPIINCYDFEAFPYNIVSLDPSYEGWIVSNYLTLVMQRKYAEKPVPFGFFLPDYTTIPGVKTVKLNRDFVSRVILDIDLLAMITNSIDEGYYIYLNLDEYFIPNRKAYRAYNNSHDVLVNGYDDVKKEIFLYGYTKNIVEQSRISYEEFILAYKSIDNIENNCQQIDLFKVENSTFVFDKNYIIYILKSYLQGKDLSQNMITIFSPEDLVFGLDCYELILSYYKEAKNNHFLKDFHRYKIPQKILEHKKIIMNLVQYLYDKKYTDNTTLLLKANKLIEEAVILKNMTIKFSLSGRDSDLNSCMNRIELIRRAEIIIFQELIQTLSL